MEYTFLKGVTELIVHAAVTGLVVGLIMSACSMVVRTELKKFKQELKDLINSKEDKR